MIRPAAALSALVAVLATAAPAVAEEASSALLPVQAATLDLGSQHSCLVFDAARVRCWGEGADGRLGYGDTEDIGDNEEPYYVERPELGPHFLEAVSLGGPMRAVSAGEQHTCALYDDLEFGDGRIACWGYGASGRLGYGNTENIGDDEWARDAAGPVDVGGAAKAVSAGGKHTCAVLVGGQVRCWGTIATGRLTFDNTTVIGDDEVPAEVAPVPLGGSAVTVVTGWVHSCALLVGGQVKCWGESGSGQLGYGFRPLYPPYEYPSEVEPVRLGGKAVAIAAGQVHTCALLESGQVRCWGDGSSRLGYGHEETIGDDEHPDESEPVRIGGEAMAIAAGGTHTCALLTTGQVRCWGYGGFGEMGTGTKESIGDDEHPDEAEPVRLGGTAVAIAAGGTHHCALLVNGQLRCWGGGFAGKLGYGDIENLGDDELPEDIGSVDFGGDSLLHSTADLSLALQVAPAEPTVGGPATITATVVDKGPFAQPRTRVRVDLPAALELSGSSAPGGDFTGNVWSVPALRPGESATLTLTATTLMPGAALISAEVTAATLPDPDSTPDNGEPGEDDLAFASLTAKTAPPPEEAPQPPPPAPQAQPQTRIGKVVQRGRKPQAVARFSADEPVRKFLCRLDDDAAFKCASPRLLTRLSPGWHLLSVTAVNVAGVPDPTPAVKRFRIRR